jgi:glutamyl-tRNA synthetase
VEVFSLEGIQAKSAVFDISKLEWMNGEHLRMLADDAAVDYLLSYANGQAIDRDYLKTLWPLVKPRIRLPRDLYADHVYFFTDPEGYDPAGVNKHFGDPLIVEKLIAYRAELAAVPAFTTEALEAQLRERAAEWNVSAGKLIHPLRLMLTGRTVSPGLFEMMAVLGRETVLRRLDTALATLATV